MPRSQELSRQGRYEQVRDSTPKKPGEKQRLSRQGRAHDIRPQPNLCQTSIDRRRHLGDISFRSEAVVYRHLTVGSWMRGRPDAEDLVVRWR
jgi:hypothetical protein